MGFGVGSGVGAGGLQGPVGAMIVLVSRVIAPFCAKARPPFRPPPTPMVAPVVMVMLTRAIRLPWSDVAVPIVAELPTAQNTAQPSAPLVNRTRAPVPVVRVEPIWKMKVGFVCALAVERQGPVQRGGGAEVVDARARVLPPRSTPDISVTGSALVAS